MLCKETTRYHTYHVITLFYIRTDFQFNFVYYNIELIRMSYIVFKLNLKQFHVRKITDEQIMHYFTMIHHGKRFNDVKFT